MGQRACEKTPSGVIPSEARNLLSVKEESGFLGQKPRSESSCRADKVLHITARLKP
jgi:hypothetical protein